MLAYIKSAQSDGQGARDAFLELMKLDPDAEIEAVESPKLRLAFGEAKRVWLLRRPRLLSDELHAKDQTMMLRLKILDSLSIVKNGVVFWRRPGETGFRRSSVLLDEQAQNRGDELPFKAQLGALRSAASVEYYAEAYSYAGTLAARFGDPASVLTARLSQRESDSRWYKKWWVWTLVGVAVAGAATTAIVVSQDNGSVGTLVVP